MSGPFHPLCQVQDFARCTPEAIDWNLGKTVETVSELLTLDSADAIAFIIDEILRLSERNFHRTVDRKVPPADVYGIFARGKGWYVKVSIDARGVLHVISFHPPTEPLRTPDGTITRS